MEPGLHVSISLPAGRFAVTLCVGNREFEQDNARFFGGETVENAGC